MKRIPNLWWILCSWALVACEEESGADVVKDAEFEWDSTLTLDQGVQEDGAIQDATLQMDSEMDSTIETDSEIDLGMDSTIEPDAEPDAEIDSTIVAACSDGKDNDGDGFIDYPNDPGCESADDNDERDPACMGFQVVDLNAAMAENGAYVGNLLEGEAKLMGSCGGGAGPEMIFSYTLSEAVNQLVFSTDYPETDKPTVLYVRSDCKSEDLTCNRSGTGGTKVLLTRPELGTYFVFVDTGNASAGAGNFKLTVSDHFATACSDGIDNDGDGLVDLFDPGCKSSEDTSEADPEILPECADGLDNDGDGLTDYPEDPDCLAAGGEKELVLCSSDFKNVAFLGQNGGMVEPVFDSNGTNLTHGSCVSTTGAEFVVALTLNEASDVSISLKEQDGSIPNYSVYLRRLCDEASSELDCWYKPTSKIKIEALEAGIWFVFFDYLKNASSPAINPLITFETRAIKTECNDGIDNDEDGLIDLMDPGCVSEKSLSETHDPDHLPECSDGIDNDNDGEIDYPNDIHCLAAGYPYEMELCSLDVNEYTFVYETSFFEGSTENQESFLEGDCGYGYTFTNVSPEDVYIVVLDKPSVVSARLNADFPSAIYVRRSCQDETSQIICDYQDYSYYQAYETALNFDRLESGIYYFVVDGVDFVDISSFDNIVIPSMGNYSLTFDISPAALYECEDGIDNDGDGFIDAEDIGCFDSYDDDETDPIILPECSDGIDNDEDGFTDYPDDPECKAAGGISEKKLCTNFDPFPISASITEVTVNFFQQSLTSGSCVSHYYDYGENVFLLHLDQLSSVKVNKLSDVYANFNFYIRKACEDSSSEIFCIEDTFGGLNIARLEAGDYFLFVEISNDDDAHSANLEIIIESLVKACNDGVDNDGDGLIDLEDPGCSHELDDSEEHDPENLPECSDGIDNDQDGFIDYPEDPECFSAGNESESIYCLDAEELIIVSSSGTFSGSTIGQSSHYCSTECGFMVGNSSGEDVYALVLTEASRVKVEITSANFDTILYYKSDCLSQGDIKCDDDGGTEMLSKIEEQRLSAGIYFFFVDGYSNSGTYEISFEIEPI